MFYVRMAPTKWRAILSFIINLLSFINAIYSFHVHHCVKFAFISFGISCKCEAFLFSAFIDLNSLIKNLRKFI